MAIKRIQIKPPTNGYADVVYPETSQDMVKGSEVYVATIGNPNEIMINTGGTFKFQQGNTLKFRWGYTNPAGGTWIGVDGIGKQLALWDGTMPVPAGVIKPNKYYEIVYDPARGDYFFLIARASGDALASQVLAGKKCSTDAGDIVGTMPDRTGGAVYATGTWTNSGAGGDLFFYLANGYYNSDIGGSVYSYDANYDPSNINDLVTIFGKQGSLVGIPGTAGDAEVIKFFQNPTIFSTNSTSYVKLGEIRIDRPVKNIRVAFQMRASSGGQAYARIYVNGVARGTERYWSSTSFTEFIEDIAVNKGDLVQFMLRTTNGSAAALYQNGSIKIGLPVIGTILQGA